MCTADKLTFKDQPKNKITKLKKALKEIASRQCPRDERSGDCPESELCYTEWCGGCIARKALEETC